MIFSADSESQEAGARGGSSVEGNSPRPKCGCAGAFSRGSFAKPQSPLAISFRAFSALKPKALVSGGHRFSAIGPGLSIFPRLPFQCHQAGVADFPLSLFQRS